MQDMLCSSHVRQNIVALYGGSVYTNFTNAQFTNTCSRKKTKKSTLSFTHHNHPRTKSRTHDLPDHPQLLLVIMPIDEGV